MNKWEEEINHKSEMDKQEMVSLLNSVQKSLTDAIAINSNDLVTLNRNLNKKQ